jgi:hypothetical protein
LVILGSVDTDDTVFASACEAVSHPFLLIDELEVAFSLTANRVFVNIFDSLDFVLMALASKIQERK